MHVRPSSDGCGSSGRNESGIERDLSRASSTAVVQMGQDRDHVRQRGVPGSRHDGSQRVGFARCSGMGIGGVCDDQFRGRHRCGQVPRGEASSDSRQVAPGGGGGRSTRWWSSTRQTAWSGFRWARRTRRSRRRTWCCHPASGSSTSRAPRTTPCWW